MPKCECCRKAKRSEDLKPMPQAINVLACSTCRETAPHLKRPTARKPARQKFPKVAADHMNKSLFSLGVFKTKKEEGNYRFELGFNYGGLSFKVGKNMTEIRSFFSKQREEKPEQVAKVQKCKGT